MEGGAGNQVHLAGPHLTGWRGLCSDMALQRCLAAPGRAAPSSPFFRWDLGAPLCMDQRLRSFLSLFPLGELGTVGTQP